MSNYTVDKFISYFNDVQIANEMYRGCVISYDVPRIIKSWGIYDMNGIYNQCLKVSGFDKPVRGRSEILIVKDDEVFLSFDKGEEYRLPGGSWESNENHMDSAMREAQEEVRINVKNVRPASAYMMYSDKPSKWVMDKIPEKDWWYGYYTEVYIGQYESRYDGNIDENDKDTMINTGKFYKISDVYDKLLPIHQKAIDDYFSL